MNMYDINIHTSISIWMNSNNEAIYQLKQSIKNENFMTTSAMFKWSKFHKNGQLGEILGSNRINLVHEICEKGRILYKRLVFFLIRVYSNNGLAFPHYDNWLDISIFGRTDAEAETPVLWPPHEKSWLIGKDSDPGRDWGQEEKGTTEDKMAGWHHWLNGHESEWTPGVGDGQGGLACCDSWGGKESDTTERLHFHFHVSGPGYIWSPGYM